MNESTLTRLKILVERAVRPVRASMCRKGKMREELLAHVTAVFEEEVARLGDEQAALARTAQRFGDPAELTGQLQEAVPALERVVERLAGWVSVRPGEATPRRAVRYVLSSAGIALLLLLVMLLLLRGVVGEWPADALWYTGPVLLVSGYLGFTLCLLESSLRRALATQTRSAWLSFALVVVGSTVVSVSLGFLAYGVSLKNALWVFVFTVGFPAVPAWLLALDFAARQRSHDDWASLQID
jgi:hypothetical protein